MKKFFVFIFSFFLFFGISVQAHSASFSVVTGDAYIYGPWDGSPSYWLNPGVDFTFGQLASGHYTIWLPGPNGISQLTCQNISGSLWVGAGVKGFQSFATLTDPRHGDQSAVIGQPCSSAPPHCSDRVKNDGEEGIDCGGTCPLNACTPVCPPGTQLLDNDWSAPDGGCKGLPNKMGCWHEAPKDRYGNCPAGYIPIYEACGRDPSLSFGCIALKDPVLAADPDHVLDSLENPWSGTGITTTESSTTTEAPNALGGVDQTTTKTATDSEGNATTETTTVHKDAAGNEVARETEKTENVPNYDAATLGKTAEDYPTDMPSDFNKSVSFGLDERLTGHASIASIGQTRLQVDSANSIVDFSFMGNQVTYDLNQGFIVEALTTIGQLLYFIALIGSFFIMFV